jgi:hypothetical protein
MAVHHTANVLWELLPLEVNAVLVVMHGVAFPIMAFFLTEGFRHTSNIKKYMLRLLIFAVISQVPHTLAFGVFMPNIIFTILLSLLCLMMHKKLYIEKQKRGLFVFLFILITIASIALRFEGALIGPVLILMYHVIKDEKKRRVWPLVMYGGVTLIMHLLNRVSFFLLETLETQELLDVVVNEGTGIARMQMEVMQQFFVLPIAAFFLIPLLLAYNGQRGRRAKWLFYAFYPGHLAVLAAIALALGVASFQVFGL